MLNISSEKFEIKDNCGGIEENFLKEHVFRFGVTDLIRESPTLGMYGIGLKRSLFKIGKKFILESDDGETHCTVNLDVIEWGKNDDWTMPLQKEDSRLEEGQNPYTRITINELNDSVKSQFSLPTFINDLRYKISVIYTLFLQRRIDISINNQKIEPFPLNIRYSDRYKPTVFKDVINDVNVKIICFIQPRKSRSEPMDRRGWNFFCNDRLILMDDMSAITGWDGEKSHLPKYHPIYNEFRGMVSLSSNDPSKLPLNTTKTGLIFEHNTYRNILNLMIQHSRPLINFLSKKYDNENKQLEDIENTVEEEIDNQDEENIKEIPLQDVEEEGTFTPPETTPPKEIVARIQYERPKELVDKLKKYLKVSSYKAVGEKTFNYFIEMEDIENE